MKLILLSWCIAFGFLSGHTTQAMNAPTHQWQLWHEFSSLYELGSLTGLGTAKRLGSAEAKVFVLLIYSQSDPLSQLEKYNSDSALAFEKLSEQIIQTIPNQASNSEIIFIPFKMHDKKQGLENVSILINKIYSIHGSKATFITIAYQEACDIVNQVTHKINTNIDTIIHIQSPIYEWSLGLSGAITKNPQAAPIKFRRLYNIFYKSLLKQLKYLPHAYIQNNSLITPVKNIRAIKSNGNSTDMSLEDFYKSSFLIQIPSLIKQIETYYQINFDFMAQFNMQQPESLPIVFINRFIDRKLKKLFFTQSNNTLAYNLTNDLSDEVLEQISIQFTKEFIISNQMLKKIKPAIYFMKEKLTGGLYSDLESLKKRYIEIKKDPLFKPSIEKMIERSLHDEALQKESPEKFKESKLKELELLKSVYPSLFKNLVTISQEAQIKLADYFNTLIDSGNSAEIRNAAFGDMSNPRFVAERNKFLWQALAHIFGFNTKEVSGYLVFFNKNFMKGTYKEPVYTMQDYVQLLKKGVPPQDKKTQEILNALTARYKIHLMPENPDLVIYTLLDALRQDPTLQNVIFNFKVLLDGQPKEVTPQGPRILALVVIYPSDGKENAQKLLDKLYPLLKDIPALNPPLTPRYNAKVNDLIFIAQGDGDYKGDQYKEFYEPSRIYYKPDITGKLEDYHLHHPETNQELVS